MTRHRLGFLPLAALLAAPVTAQSTRYTLKGDSVAVYNLVGELRVEPASGSAVTVELTRGGADAARLEVQTGPLRGRGMEAYADLRVSVPAGKGVELHLGVGKAFVSNVDGVIRVDVASADVAADRTRGTLKIATGSGNVDLRDAAGDVALETGSGDVTLKVPPSMSAQVDLDTGSDDIDLGGLTIQVRRLEQDHITGTIGDGKGRLSIETGSGNVHLVKL